jgi:hypothetical protein
MRAAMVGGTAYVAGRAGQRAAQREETDAEPEAQPQQQQEQQQVAPAGGPTDISAQLTELKNLADQGALTPDEFQAAKQKLLYG